MKLAHSLGLVLSGCILLVLSGTGAFWVYRERNLVDEEARAHLAILGSAVRPAFAHDLETEGPVHAVAMLQTMVASLDSSDEVTVRWEEAAAASATGRRPRTTAERVELYLPVTGPRPGAIVLSRSLERERAFVWQSARNGLATLLGLGLVLQVAVLLTGRVLVGRPLARLVEQTRRISKGDLAGRLRFRGRQELDVIAVELNAMCDELHKARERVASEHAERVSLLLQMRHADRLATVGKLAAGVAHELGTPLTVVLSRAKLIAVGQHRGPEAERSAQIIAEQVARITGIVRQLLDFARREGQPKVLGDVVPLVRSTLSLLLPMASKRGVRLELLAQGPQHAEVDANQLGQAVANLVVNGLQAMREGGALTVEVATARARPPQETALPEGDYVLIAVQDHGSGITKENLPHVFDPFFTTKPVGEGTGLGLSVAYGIAREHGGWIDARSEPGAGSCFSIHLPRLGGGATAWSSPAAS